MAYGRDAQAEEILKESLAKDPNRTAVHAKLLEIYASRKDSKNFEQTALKLKGLTNGTGPEWDKAMALGSSIDPGNGLYSGGAAAAAAAAPAAAAPTLDFDIGGGAEPGSRKPSRKPSGLDFDIGAAAACAGGRFRLGGTQSLIRTEAKPAGGRALISTSAVVRRQREDDAGRAEEGAPRRILMPTVAMDFDLNLDLGSSKA
jgi:hypothetical protein